MGCTICKNTEEDTPRIDSHFELTGVFNLDSYIKKVRDCLSELEEIRSGIVDNRELLIKGTYAQYLKEPSFKEAIKLFFWVLSANLQGDISMAKPIIYDKANYISLTLPINVRFEVTKLWTTLNNYDNTLRDAPTKLNPLLNTFLAQLEKAPALLDKAGEEATRSGQNSIKKTKTIINVTNNISKIRNQVDKIKRLPDLINEAKREFEGMLPYLREQLAKADEVGMQAYHNSRYLPRDIFDNYETTPKKTAEEIAAINLAAGQINKS